GLQHLDAGSVDLIDGPRQLEAKQARASAQPLAVLTKLEDLAIIGALPLEHAARIVERMSQHMHSSVAPRHQLAIEPDPAVAVVERALLLSHWGVHLLRNCNAPRRGALPRQASELASSTGPERQVRALSPPRRAPRRAEQQRRS